MRTLFRGRDDVYAVRWTNARTGKSGYAPAVAGGWGGSNRDAKDHLPLTDEAIEDHLIGRATIGIYPLLDGDTCWFLACDFDGPGWAVDALGFLKVCRQRRISAYVKRSRSGQGAHVWLFFGEAVKASLARRLGAGLLRETMLECGELDLESYDRLFPSQDFVPKGSFGNLIALPLQGENRQLGCTEFLDPTTLQPWPDQWASLSGIHRLTASETHDIADAVRSINVGPQSTLDARPMRGQQAPPAIDCILDAGLSLERGGLPPALLSAIKHLATVHNPEFYRRQKQRFSTFQTPRFIRCYDQDLTHLRLPRGVLEGLELVAKEFGSTLSVTDQRQVPSAMNLEFTGTLDDVQERAVADLLPHDMGVLVAPPGTGKTVMGCAVIAERNLPTLILVHREPLVEQWRNRLADGLGIPADEIGLLARGKDKRNGRLDVAMIQSLRTIEDLETFFGNYGCLVVDECHHVPAVSFEACVKRAPIRFILGLTATPYRKDGLEDLITMQCGPIRHEIKRRPHDTSGLLLSLHAQPTDLALDGSQEMPIQEIFRAVVESGERSRSIVRDVVSALSQRRRCLVLTEWKEHVRTLAGLLQEANVEPIVLEGGMGKKQRSALLKRIEETSPEQDLVIVSTGQYIGEGFDCPQLDTLFLAFPVAFKGKLVQYTGRILRAHEGKDAAIVYDYVDSGVPVLKAMFAKRLRAYKSLGFEASKRTEPAGPTIADAGEDGCEVAFEWILDPPVDA